MSTSKTLPRQSVTDQVEPERREGPTVCGPGHDVKSKRVDDGALRAGQTLPVTCALKLPLFLSVGPERRIILSGSRPHSWSPPLYLKDVCRGIKQQMSISVLLHMHPASPSSTQQRPAVLWSGAEASIPAQRGDARLRRPAWLCAPRRCQSWATDGRRELRSLSVLASQGQSHRTRQALPHGHIVLHAVCDLNYKLPRGLVNNIFFFNFANKCNERACSSGLKPIAPLTNCASIIKRKCE